MRLTAQQLADFEHDGVIYLGRVLDDDEVAEGNRRFRTMLEAGILQDLYDNSSGGPRQVHLRVNNAWKHDDWYRQLLYKPELLDIAASVLGPNIQLLHDQMFYKPPHDAAPSLWHIDNAYWHFEPANAASIWIAMSDTDLENACLHMLLGSHRNPPQAEEISVDSGKMKLQSLAIDESQLRPFPMPAGHALMHHCKTVHGAYANNSGRDRFAFAIHYMQSGIKRRDGFAFDDLENFLLLHGEIQR